VPPTELTERRRTEIVHAAFAEFAERGYHNTGIADIARRLGIGHGTFYRYFANKRDILVHVLDHTVDRLRTVVARDAPGAAETLTGYRAQVQRIGYAMFDLFVDDPQLMRMCFVEPMSVDAELADRVLATHEAMGALTEEYLRHGVRRGFLRADLDTAVTARAVNGMVIAAGLSLPRTAPDRDRWVNALTALMFDGISSPGAARAAE
jgi:AcrR family transcriptional regulator